MSPSHAVPAPIRTLWAAVVVVVVGAMVLAGWAFDIAALKSVSPGWVAMKANAAVCFILTGIALLLTVRPPATFNPQLSTFFFRFARLCGLLAGLIGLLTLCEYIFSWNPGIDQWLFREPDGTVGTSYPGRMAPEAALSFVLLTAALWITSGSRKTRWTILAAVNLGLLVTSLALAAVLSYLTPGLGTYGWFGLTIMAMHTAVLFAMLGMAVIAISWRQDVLPWSLGRNTTAAFACGMAVLVLIGFNTSRSYFWMEEKNRQITYREETLNAIDSVVTEIIDAQAHVLSYVITGDEQPKTHYLEAKAISNAKLDALRKLVAGNPIQQQQFAQVEEGVNEELQWFQQAINAERTGINDAARIKMIVHGDNLLRNLHITSKQIESDHDQIIQQLNLESEGVSWLSYLIIFIGTFTSLLIFLVVIFRLNFAVNERKQAQEAMRVSRENLHRLLNSMAEGAYGVDSNGDCTFVNRAFLQMLGYQNENELLGKHIHDLIHHSHADGSPYPDSECNVYRAYRTNQPTNISDEVFWRKDGVAIPVEYGSRPIKTDGAVIGAIVTFMDITERKRAETEIFVAQSGLAATLDAIPDLLFEVGLDGRYFDYHSSHPELLAAPPEVFIGKTVRDVLPPDMANVIMLALRDAHETGRSHGRQIELQVPQGKSWFDSPLPASLSWRDWSLVLSCCRVTSPSASEQRLILENTSGCCANWRLRT